MHESFNLAYPVITVSWFQWNVEQHRKNRKSFYITASIIITRVRVLFFYPDKYYEVRSSTRELLYHARRDTTISVRLVCVMLIIAHGSRIVQNCK